MAQNWIQFPLEIPPFLANKRQQTSFVCFLPIDKIFLLVFINLSLCVLTKQHKERVIVNTITMRQLLNAIATTNHIPQRWYFPCAEIDNFLHNKNPLVFSGQTLHQIITFEIIDSWCLEKYPGSATSTQEVSECSIMGNISF